MSGAAQVMDQPRRLSPARRLMRDVPAMIALVFLVLVVLAALFAPWLTPYDPYATSMRVRLRPPSELHWLGNDTQGRDLLTRLLYGTRMTLLIGVTAVAIGGSLGALLGILAAFYRRLDNPIMRLVDVLLSFPSILFGLALAAVLGPGLVSLVAALSVAAVPTMARISRGAATVVMQQDYIEAGRAIGLSDAALMWRYLLLNCFSTIMVYMTLQLGQAILLGAVLSFLGLGAQPPTAELGVIAAEGRNFITRFPHVSTFPSLLIFMIVLAFNVLGDALRDALDPRLRQ